MRFSCVVTAMMLVACGNPTGPTRPAATAAPAPAPAAAPASSPPAATVDAGPTLTSDMIAKAYQDVSVLGTWDEVFGNLTGRLGPPTKVGGTGPLIEKDGGPVQRWAVIEGDTCTLLTLQADAQGLKHANYGTFQRGKMLFDDCAGAVAGAATP